MAGINLAKQKITCKNCTEVIFSSHTVCIRCQVCQPALDLCPDCHACNLQLGSHTPLHPYLVIDSGEFPVLRSEWTAREHMELLDAVEQYGYGNWGDIAKKVTYRRAAGQQQQQQGRAPDEAREEFGEAFVLGGIGASTWREDDRGRARDHTQGNPLLPPEPAPAPLGPSDMQAAMSGPGLHETTMLGYMPLRDDFEVEFDNEAEGLVSSLQGGLNALPDEDEMDHGLKMAHVDMYKFKLRERERRKRVAREHQLVSQYFKENPLQLLGERRSTGNKTKKKGERTHADITERLKVLAEFQGVQEHRQFMKDISKEKELKSRIKDLQRSRKNGITQLKDGTEYEIQRIRRIKRKKELNRAMAAASNEGPLTVKTEPTDADSGSPLNSSLSPTKSAMDDKFLPIAGLPGYELLSLNEKKLCVNLKLTPAHYVSYKTCLLTNHLQKKKGQTPKPLNPVGLDKNNRKIIFQFLMRAGWITAY